MHVRRRTITALLAAVATAAGLVAAASPASAAPVPGQSSIFYSFVSRSMQPTGDRIGLTVQVFGYHHEPLAYSGTAILSSELGGASATVPIASADGSSSDVSASTAGMTPGDFMTPGTVTVSLELTAAGDDTAWHSSVGLGNLVQFNGGPPHLDGPQESIWWPIAQDWGCDRVVYAGYGGSSNYLTCVTNRPTTGDETWQRGYKLTFNWTPQTAPDGHQYERCKLWFILPSTNGAPQNTYMMGVDVPGSWTTYTVPLPSNSVDYALTPGSTTLDQRVSCFDYGQTAGAEQTQPGALVPDIPPTQPTTADVAADGSDVDATVGGSRALGVSPMQGYRTSLVDANGAVVTSAVIRAGAVRSASVSASGKPAGRVVHTFGHIKPGTYRLRVSSFNAIGTSAVTESSVVHVTGRTAVSAPRSVKARATASKVQLRWKAPTRAGSGIAKYRIVLTRGTHHVTKTVSAKQHALTLKKLHSRTKYRVSVTAIDTAGHTGATQVRFTTKR
jgi:hypothetical protein